MPRIASIVRRLGSWSLAQLVFVCFAWIALWILTPIAYVAATFLLMTMGTQTGSGGVGAVSAGLSAPVLVGPILVLIALWVVAKRTAGRTPPPGTGAAPPRPGEGH